MPAAGEPSLPCPSSAVGAFGHLSGEHAHDVGFLHDQEIFTVELDFGA
jgi:hypothetical protein